MLMVPGFHIPQAEVHLLSPQVLLQEIGGSYLGMTDKLAFTLGDGKLLDAFYVHAHTLRAFEQLVTADSWRPHVFGPKHLNSNQQKHHLPIPHCFLPPTPT